MRVSRLTVSREFDRIKSVKGERSTMTDWMQALIGIGAYVGCAIILLKLPDSVREFLFNEGPGFVGLYKKILTILGIIVLAPVSLINFVSGGRVVRALGAENLLRPF